MAHQHDHLLTLDEVLVLHVGVAVEDHRAARHCEVGFHLDELIADNGHEPRARAQDVEIVGDFHRQPIERLGDFVPSERSQARETQFEDRARLRFREANGAVGVERVARIGDERDERRHVARRPHPLHQRRSCGGRIGGRADEADHLVDVGDRDRQADLHMRVVARLGQQIFGPPRDDFLAEVEERAQHVGQRQHLGTAAVERDHVGAERRLQGGLKRQSWLSTTSATASRLISMTTCGMPSRSDLVTRRSEMPSTRFSRTSSAMRSISVALLT